MMKKVYLGLVLFGLLSAQSCDADNDNVKVPASIETAFNTKYPHARYVEWEAKYDYYVAEFKDDGVEKEAWYNVAAEWQMTESEIAYRDLPTAVKNAYESSEYEDGWRVNDVDMLERNGMETVYVLDAEKTLTDQDVDLYYNVDGKLLKVEYDDDDEHLPSNTLPAEIKDYLSTHFSGYSIIDVDYETIVTEVEILYSNEFKEIVFAANNNWVSTTTEKRVSDLPTAVANYINANYPNKRIDDVDYVETTTAEYYEVELDTEPNDTIIKIKADGTLVP